MAGYVDSRHAMTGYEDEEEEDPEEVEPWLQSSDEEPEVPALETWNPSPDSEPEQQPPPPPPAPTNSASEVMDMAEVETEAAPRWPGFPGTSVFRLVVAGDKVGGLIGRGGEIIRRLCEETRARVRILDSTDGGASRIVRTSPWNFG
jgi:poly(rC)-binding protein 2/3/4